MTQQKIRTAIIILFFLGILVTGTATLSPQEKASRPIERREEPAVQGIGSETKNEIDKGVPATVLKVIDGDTIEVDIQGSKQKIRIIGINTPESVDPRRPVECFGKEAAGAAKQKLTGQVVQLKTDPTQDDRDKYGRLLRYVWTDAGKTDFGAWMIKNGYAYEYTYSTPHTYQDDYRQLQNEAEVANQGLWGVTTCNGITKEEKQSTLNKKQCADFTTQTEAQAYFDNAGGASSPEVKGMDGNNDGTVCESLP
ncbi:MAG: thermonuclease family protein [Patescibacteria group bacterium]